MFNLLSASIGITTMPELNNPYSLNFIGIFIKWLIENLPNMGLGIIVFTLALKLVTLPLDIYSRVSMKKNNLKMERMRPQLEKLQRQYANNKDLYNQKIAALYKKEGYSALSSCLPTLVTLIVFIIVINQFSNYSSYANLQLIQGMADSYNAAVESYDQENGTNVVVQEGGEYRLNVSAVFSTEKLAEIGVKEVENKYFAEDTEKFYNYLKSLNGTGYTDYDADSVILKDDGYKFSHENYDSTKTQEDINKDVTTAVITAQCTDAISSIEDYASQAAAKYYKENVPSFLWVKNIWVEDLPWKHPVREQFSDYNFTVRKGCTSETANIDMSKELYSKLTASLEDEKSSPNGYLILVVLSIGVMILSTVISNKAQKAQMELQTVDSSAAQTSKMMTWMMPIMFGVFAFIYTASFSIYMVVNSLVSTLSMLIINKVVEDRFNKKIEEENAKASFSRRVK